MKGIEQYKARFVKEEKKEEAKAKKSVQVEKQTEKTEEQSVHRSCWNCYRLFDARYEKLVEGRPLCSDKCIEQYRENTKVGTVYP